MFARKEAYYQKIQIKLSKDSNYVYKNMYMSLYYF